MAPSAAHADTPTAHGLHSNMAWLLCLLPVLLVFLGLAVTILNTPVNPHDDLRDIERYFARPYMEAFTIPWLCDTCAMYRPVLGSLMKTLATLSGMNSLGLRGPVLVLIGIFLALCTAIFFRFSKDPVPLSIALLYLLGSPFLFHPYTYFGNVSALIVITVFAFCVWQSLSDEVSSRQCLLMTLAFAISLFSNELGLANVVFVLVFLCRRRYGLALVFVSPVVVYLAARIAVTGSLAGPPVYNDSGYMFETLSGEDIRTRFPGAEIYWFNLYTSFTQFAAVFTRLFKNGELYMSLKVLPFALGLIFIVPYVIGLVRRPGRERWLVALLLVATVLTALLSHKYARDRNMAMGATSYAIILFMAIASRRQFALARSKLMTPLLAALYVSWLFMAVNTIKNLNDETIRFQAFFEENESYSKDDLSVEFYRTARDNYIQLF